MAAFDLEQYLQGLTLSDGYTERKLGQHQAGGRPSSFRKRTAILDDEIVRWEAG